MSRARITAGVALAGAVLALSAAESGAAAVRPAQLADQAITVTAAAGFSPNGDHVLDTWSVGAHVSVQADLATLTVRSGTTLVRRLAAPVTAGELTPIAWDGRDYRGTALPSGLYAWTLDASLSGAVTAHASGVVGSARIAPYSRVSVPPVAALVTTNKGRVPATWGTTTAPQPGEHLVYDVQYRDFTWLYLGHGQTTEPAVVASGTTTTSANVDTPADWADKPLTRQVRARARDDLGNIGAWSPWASSDMAADEGDGARLGEFDPVASPDAYGGRYGLSTYAGSGGLSYAFDGSTVVVIGLLCPKCGVVGITVNGVQHKLSTYSPTWRHRQVLTTFHLPYGVQQIDVVNRSYTDRQYVGIDAIAVH